MKFVGDTNILIDLYHGGLLVTAFSTGDEWIITDLAAEELETPGIKHLISLGLEVRRISGDQMGDVVELVNRYPAPSVQDLSLLPIAKRGRHAITYWRSSPETRCDSGKRAGTWHVVVSGYAS